MSQHALVVVDHHTARIYHLDGHDAGSLAVRQAAVREINLTSTAAAPAAAAGKDGVVQ